MWSWFKQKPQKKSNAPPPEIDRLTYAIGDIHGCNDLFIKLLADIQSDAAAIGEVPRLVLLGDYVDRGPDSSGVLDTIIELEVQPWCVLHILLGNHEMMLKRFLLESSYGPDWAAYGGAATLNSYNVPTPQPRAPEEAWEDARRLLAQNMPDHHGKLLDRAELMYLAGDYLFVHGGVKPGVPLEEQKSDTLLWIREEFLSSPKACDYVVVHGHSASEQVMQTDWRIGVDTGAYATGVLTAVRLRGSEREFIKASR